MIPPSIRDIIILFIGIIIGKFWDQIRDFIEKTKKGLNKIKKRGFNGPGIK